MKIKVSHLEDLVTKAILKKYDPEDAKRISDVVLFGELSGKTSHGLIRLLIGDSSVFAQNPTGKPRIIKKTKFSSLIEGNKNPAMLIASLAMSEVINLAKENGIGMVGTKGIHSTSGCLSYYLEKIGRENLIGIIMARSPNDAVPFNSLEKLFGTNPVGFVFPTNISPFIFDMATSAISYGAIIKAKTNGQKLPENVAIDKEGNATTDPSEALEGGILPFDRSYKGSGLGMVVEILAGVLTGAGFTDINNKNGWGNLFLAFSPKILSDEADFKKNIHKLVERVRNSKTRDGKKVRIPGEKTLETRDQALRKGEVEVDDELIAKVKNFIEK